MPPASDQTGFSGHTTRSQTFLPETATKTLQKHTAVPLHIQHLYKADLKDRLDTETVEILKADVPWAQSDFKCIVKEGLIAEFLVKI